MALFCSYGILTYFTIISRKNPVEAIDPINFDRRTARQSSIHQNTEQDQNKCLCASGREQRLVQTGLKPELNAELWLLQLGQPTCTHCKTLTFLHAGCHKHMHKLIRATSDKLFLWIERPCLYCNAAEIPGALKKMREKDTFRVRNLWLLLYGSLKSKQNIRNKRVLR